MKVVARNGRKGIEGMSSMALQRVLLARAIERTVLAVGRAVETLEHLQRKHLRQSDALREMDRMLGIADSKSPIANGRNGRNIEQPTAAQRSPGRGGTGENRLTNDKHRDSRA